MLNRNELEILHRDMARCMEENFGVYLRNSTENDAYNFALDLAYNDDGINDAQDEYLEMCEQVLGYQKEQKDFGENIPESAYDDKGIVFSKTAFHDSNPAFSCLSDDVVIALKEKPYIFSIFGRQRRAEAKSFSAHLEIFKSIVLYEK